MIERSHTLRGLQENKMKDRLKDRDVQVTWKENLDIPECKTPQGGRKLIHS